MSSISFDTFKPILLDYCRVNLEQFAATADNKEVYAVALDVSAAYGWVNLMWNTLDSLDQTVQKHYSSYSLDRIHGFKGVKYSVGDFSYDASNAPEEIDDFVVWYADKLSNLYDDEDETDDAAFAACEEMTGTFINMLVEVIQELRPTFELLNKTDNFIAYIVEHDEHHMAYMRRTVSEEDYYKAFPEIREFELYKLNISEWPEAKQVEHWCSLLKDILLKQSSEEATIFQAMYRDEFDVERELIQLGAPAAGEIVHLYQKLCGYTPTEDGSILQGDSWTCLSILIDIGEADEMVITQLYRVLSHKYEVDKAYQECINIARTLHALDATRFPEEEHDENRTRLTNFDSYKL